MIATSIEQSRRLIAAGVSVESADATWVGIDTYKGKEMGIVHELLCGLHHGIGRDKWIPAWSLAALWDVLHHLDKTYEFETNMSAEVFLGVLVNLICIRFENR